VTPAADTVAPAPRDRSFWVVNALVSIVALGVLAYLLLVRRGGDHPDPNALAFMPAVNACFNAASAALLVLAARAIKRRDVARHRALVLAAFASSTLFLAGYLAYHYVHGDTRYPAGAPLRGPYLLLLASHVLLSVPVVPMCLAAFYFALQRRFAAHTKVTRVLYPVWLYVSVTGVLVFAMLRAAGA
jgi:putative membrane protein